MVSRLGVGSFLRRQLAIRLEANHLTSPVVKCNHKSDRISTLPYKTDWLKSEKTFICFLGIYHVKIFTSLKVNAHLASLENPPYSAILP
jgi:hypothetical protein